jgi:hypothetical protein
MYLTIKKLFCDNTEYAVTGYLQIRARIMDPEQHVSCRNTQVCGSNASSLQMKVSTLPTEVEKHNNNKKFEQSEVASVCSSLFQSTR